MSKKVLVADDSQTIQKVINITFANQDFEIVSALDESELFSKSDDFDLILLDFGLSDDGYKLGEETRKKFPTTPVLAMLGTFDIVDENKLRASGYSDKVVKPFETEKFISLCNELIESGVPDMDTSNESFEDGQEDFESNDQETEDNFSGWDVDSSIAQSEEDKTQEFDLSANNTFDGDSEDLDNNLQSELDGWGFDPTNLKGSDVTKEFDSFPPVIDGLPEDKQDDVSSVLDVSNYFGNLDDDLGDDFDLTEPEQEESEEITFEASAEDDQDFEEISDENLWDADEESTEMFSSPEEDEHEINLSSVTQMNDDFSFGSSATASINTSASAAPATSAPPVDVEELKAELRNEVAPIIEKYAREYCEQNIEKIIWEIVPDLAENLIKKELKNISKQVLTSISE
ncbi:response regulator receiver domain protein [Bacteriovorax sp. BAL6_X]|uniref:response regulator n=1 Tax=Bacteriovorax sp. BAL6_X TaxID=1201290 RepID=UPI000385C679|nr:response regulator [Bacteriovorax sp. BAL6_X]EPZ51890.1 response regulator receiver domain protein [Bacteriovorax sp. BAL6_X]